MNGKAPRLNRQQEPKHAFDQLLGAEEQRNAGKWLFREREGYAQGGGADPGKKKAGSKADRSRKAHE